MYDVILIQACTVKFTYPFAKVLLGKYGCVERKPDGVHAA